MIHNFFRKETRLLKTILFSILLIVSYYAKSQSNIDTLRQKRERVSWTNVGLIGIGMFQTAELAAHAGINTNFSVKKLFVQVGINGNFAGFGDYISDINISIGKREFGRFYHISGFIGPGLVIGDVDFDRFTTIGLSINIQLVFKPIKPAGIGIGIYGNLNNRQSVIGIRGIIHFSNGK